METGLTTHHSPLTTLHSLFAIHPCNTIRFFFAKRSFTIGASPIPLKSLKSNTMTLIKQAFLTLIAGALCLGAVGQYKMTDPIPTDPDIKIGKLANGLTYYIRKNVKPEKKV